jgi:hypothetical protein
MNEQTYDQQAINAYLLGALSAADAERFDELSFTDDDFAAQLQAAEKDLVDAYVHGELSGSELEQFKSYYLASSLRREKVEFAQTFQIYAKKSAAAQNIKTLKDAEPIAGEKSQRTRGGFFSNLFGVPRLSMQWGFALATLFFVFFAGWLLFENSRLQNQTDEAQARRSELQQRESELENEITNQRSADADKEAELARVRGEIARLEQEQEQNSRRIAEMEKERRRLSEQQQQKSETANAVKRSPAPPSQISIASFILTPQLRGASQIQTLSIPEKTGSVDLRLELEPNDYEAFRVTLANQSGGQVIWRSGTVKAKGDGENKSLNIRFPAKLLKSSQIYTLEVSGGGAGEIISNYSFRTTQK